MHASIITEPGYDIGELAGFASIIDADKFEIFCLPENKNFEPESYLNLLFAHLKELAPDVIVMAELPSLSGIAPALAVKLCMHCVNAVQGMNKSYGKLKLMRGVLGGKAVMETAVNFPAVITIVPGAFKKNAIAPLSNIPITQLTVDSLRGVKPPGRMKNLGIIEQQTQSSGLPITEAEILISAGRGIIKEENLELIRKLAGMFNSSAVAGSRAVIDAGWLPYSAQVGLTGKTVTPKLYMACGISGSPQHIAGMRDSHLIIAINKDANAAIFNYSHYCILEDLLEFIPVLIEVLK
jgi:electron transfer flavoprotein alpha subunit